MTVEENEETNAPVIHHLLTKTLSNLLLVEDFITGLMDSTKIVDPLLCRRQTPPEISDTNEYLPFCVSVDWEV